MAIANPNDPQTSSLERKFWRQWLFLSTLWLVIALAYLMVNWQEIYPKRPYYLLAPDQAAESLNTWYTMDEEASVRSLKHQLHMPDAEELRVEGNILLLPKGIGEAKREHLLEQARAMRLTLDERFVRTIVYRFAPMVLLFLLAPPFALMLLGRLAKWAMLRWVGGP